jgi:hypothetical protein
MSKLDGGGISLSDFDEQFKHLIIPHGLALSKKYISKSCYDVYDTDECINDSLYDKLLKLASYEEPEKDIEKENAMKREIEEKKEIEKAKDVEVKLNPVQSNNLNKKKTKSKNRKLNEKQTRRKRS